MTRPVSEVLPHREPFVFVDAVETLEDDHIVATHTIREDADYLRGHYPGRPLVPGVLLVEMALQTGAYFMAVTSDADLSGRIPVVSRLESVKFKRPVGPGDVVSIEARPIEQIGPAHRMSARLRCGGKIVCMLEFTVLLAEDGP